MAGRRRCRPATTPCSSTARAGAGVRRAGSAEAALRRDAAVHFIGVQVVERRAFDDVPPERRERDRAVGCTRGSSRATPERARVDEPAPFHDVRHAGRLPADRAGVAAARGAAARSRRRGRIAALGPLERTVVLGRRRRRRRRLAGRLRGGRRRRACRPGCARTRRLVPVSRGQAAATDRVAGELRGRAVPRTGGRVEFRRCPATSTARRRLPAAARPHAATSSAWCRSPATPPTAATCACCSRGQPSIVLAVHAGPIDYAALPVRARRRAPRRRCRCPCRGSCTTTTRSASSACRTSATSRCRRISARPSAPTAAQRYREAVGLIARLQQRGAELASPAYPPYGVAFDVEKLTWELEFFVRHFLLAYRGALPDEPVRAALREEWARIVEELAAEPRVLCHRDYHSRNLMWHDEHALRHRLPGRAHGARHLRPGVAAARFLRRPARRRRRRPHRLLLRARPRHRGAAGDRGVPPPVRPDGAAAQPEGARHLRLPDDDARQPGLHAVRAAHAGLRAAHPRRRRRASAGSPSCSAGLVDELR